MTFSLAAYIFFTVACAYIVKGLVGFGDPLISNPLLSLRLNNRDYTPALLPVNLLLNIFIVYRNRKALSLRQVLPIALCVLLGVVPGTMLLKYGAPWILKVILGLLIMGLGVEMLTRDKARQLKPNPVVQALVSFLSGVTAGLFGINLLFLIYLERTAKGREEFRASVCFIFLVENLFRLAVYITSGMFTPFSLQMCALCIPASFLGLWIGSRIDKKINESRIRKLIIYVFILGGLSTLVNTLIAVM